MGSVAIDGSGWKNAEAQALRQSLQESLASLRTREAELTQCRGQLARAEREIAETHHRITNNLHLIIAFLRIQERATAPNGLKESLISAITRIEAVARLHRQFRKNPSSLPLDFGAFVGALARDLSASLGVRCAVFAQPVEVSEALAVDLAIAINELAVNAAKYGCSPDGIADIEIACCRDDKRSLCITVKDRGPGIPAQPVPRPKGSLGLSFVQAIVSQHGGDVLTENNNGAQVTIRIPGRPVGTESRTVGAPQSR
ncbi:MAG: hypothetical protein JWO50_890 [Candidatus Kaiserbacteria bacterium]|nr:hypothetical protein [Candidatus Kaiserbacteria bacterium]